MSEKSSASSGGIGFVGLLTILFIALKLTKVIDWSWWWVLSPLWIGFAIAMSIMLVIVAALFARELFKKPKPPVRRF